MQATTAQATSIAQASARPAGRTAAAANAYQGYQILRRNGAVVSFEPNKIAVALMKAFLAVHGTQGAASASVRETVDGLTESVVRALLRSRPGGGTFHIEDIQDQVELGLMRGGHHEVARAYVLYRERRAQERAKQGPVVAKAEPVLMVTDRGNRVPLDAARLQTYRAAWLRDRGGLVTKEVAMAKMAATESAQRAIDRAVQILGGRGVVQGAITERLYRDIRALRIYEGATEVQKLIIARELLNEARNT
jgi:ribonucleoside-diphosphate reductase alpha chain